MISEVNRQKIQKYLEENELDAILLTGPANIRWLTGFPGEDCYVLLTAKEIIFVTDSRYMEAAQKRLDGTARLVNLTGGLAKTLKEAAGSLCIKNLGLEYSRVTLAQNAVIKEAFDAETKDVSPFFGGLRAVKTADELERMRKGARLTESIYYDLLKVIRPGVTEFDLLAEMQYLMNKAGAAPSFAPIIAGGENSSVPHATVTSRALKEGDLLTMDFGCFLDGICTDFTRTIALSGVDEETKLIYNTVRSANLTALRRVCAGTAAREVDKAARDVISDAGYADCFGHGTGHGVGVEIHEAPTLNSRSSEILCESMVVTIEPGIYIPGKGGVRIEDMVIVTGDGHENFYTASKDLMII